MTTTDDDTPKQKTIGEMSRNATWSRTGWELPKNPAEAERIAIIMESCGVDEATAAVMARRQAEVSRRRSAERPTPSGLDGRRGR